MTRSEKLIVQTKIADITLSIIFDPIRFHFLPYSSPPFLTQLTQFLTFAHVAKVPLKEGVIFTVTYDPASLISGHVTVHLHTLAGVSVDVNGVDAAQRLSIQQVLGAILRCCKQTTPWREAGEAQGCYDYVRILSSHLLTLNDSVGRDSCRLHG